jgi:hypothetical protein
MFNKNSAKYEPSCPVMPVMSAFGKRASLFWGKGGILKNKKIILHLLSVIKRLKVNYNLGQGMVKQGRRIVGGWWLVGFIAVS